MSDQEMYLAVLIACGVLLAGVVAVRVSSRSSMPGLLLYLGIGLIIGEAGFGIRFDDARLAYNISVLLVAVLLFDGGFTTRWSEFRPVAWKSGLLGTVGVLVSIAVAATVAVLVLGVDVRTGILLAAMVSSTDAAAVFAILRRLPLKARVRTTLEGESGVNDPPAIIIVTVVVSDAWDQMDIPSMITTGLFQLAAGAVVGLVIARIGQSLLHRISLPSAGLYPLATLAIALTAYSTAGTLQASGLLAAYVAGLWLGNQALPHHASTEGFTESLGWLSQIMLFVLLGLLASPKELPAAIIPALVIGSALMFLARPISVAVCLAPFRERFRTQVFISAAGMRGAVPIMLATIPLTQNLPGATRMFHVIFLLVATFTLIQAPLLPKLARWAGVLDAISPQALAFDSSPLEGINASLVQFTVPRKGQLVGMWCTDLRLPHGAVLSMVVRDKQIIVPDSELRIQGGDHLLMAVESGLVELVQARLTLLNQHGPLARWLISGRNRRRLLGDE
ncbi:potassium/proton antiporter [Arachnia propionica]|uniref:Potassium/proton antiporter n=1 Tax=Arachnia propionica TaxID=1750 RepID=A0A3P1T2H4_9ACTN|nr:potassium/proton antiporter [Arachnia propionica]RRD03564.1 potassium/proton antiporter [Arachnia propionica]